MNRRRALGATPWTGMFVALVVVTTGILAPGSALADRLGPPVPVSDALLEGGRAPQESESTVASAETAPRRDGIEVPGTSGPSATAGTTAVAADSSATPVVAPNTPGVVTGYVTDTESGRGLPYTNIVIYTVEAGDRRMQIGGSIALTRGQYFARVNPGRYELNFLYLGYEPYTSEVLEVRPGETLELDVPMKVKPIEFQTFTVQATKITNTAVSALVEKKKSVAVQEAITAEEISRSTDSDAAEALERVTGLSVVGGKFVFVRGLGDRYSSTSLNGTSLSSPEPNRRTVPLDIFPAAMLDNVVVQKTFTPDMDGEFGGGNIDIQTREAIDERQFSQKFSIGYAENVFTDDYYTYDGGRTDWLGLDDGTRGLPRILDPYADEKLPDKRNFLGEGLPVQQLSAIREAFPNTWTPRREDGIPNFGYSGLYADRYELFGRQGSFLLAGSLSNGFNTREFEETDFRGGSGEEVQTRSTFDVAQSERSTLLGLTGAFNLRATDASRLSYNLLYTRGSEDKARVATGVNDQSETFLQNTLTYVERDLLSHVFRGQHALNGAGSELEWMVNYSQANRNEPDRRFSEFKETTFYVFDPDDSEEIIDQYQGWGKSPLGFPFVRVFGESQEDDMGLKLNWNFRLPETSWADRGLKLGYSFRDRERSTRYRRFGIDCQTCDFDGSGRGEQVFDRSTYDDPTTLDRQIIRETTDSSDQYDAGQEVSGLYAMSDWYLFDTIRLVGGARYETSEQFVLAESSNVAAADRERKETSLVTSNWLPAFNATWTATERINVRLAYSRTLNRPEMRELSPFSNYNYEENVEEQGNLFVQQAEIDSYDFRFEVYPGLRRYMAFSLFRKELDNPIERILFAQAAGNLKEVPGNGEEGTLEGWEIEWRGGMGDAVQGVGQLGNAVAWTATRPLWLLGQVPGLGFFEGATVDLRRVQAPDAPGLANWGLSFNFSKIESEVTINRTRLLDEIRATTEGAELSEETAGGILTSTAPLTGQSSYALNAGLIYGNGRQDFSLMLKAFGDRLTAFGVGSPDLYEDVPAVIDAAWATRLGPSVKLKFGLENILDERRRFVYDDSNGETFVDLEGNEVDVPLRRAWRDGRKLSISLTYAP